MLTHGTCSSLCLIYNERMKKLFTKGTIALIVICELPPVDSGYRGEIHAIISNVSNQAQSLYVGSGRGVLEDAEDR